MKTGLVLEGGAMRGLFTAGVLDILMERGVKFDGLVGVSAGACFGCNYKSGQTGRVIRYNTRFAAGIIAKKAGADIFEIKAEKPYNSDFQKCCDEAKPECNGKTLRPIKPIEGFDLAKYDIVFVGTPNWWGTMAPPVRTWVTQSKEALKGKTVCLFQTHGGGGMP